jgi:cation diffusion facilitator family transporter
MEEQSTQNREKKGGAAKVIFAAIAANLGIAVSKFVVAGITGSAAMLAEGIHSAVDTGNELLLLIGEHNSEKKPDARHPFGYGKVVYFWALIVALSVFTLGGGFSIYHGIHAILNPEAPTDPMWNYVVLGVAALFEGYSWNISRKALNKVKKPGTNLWQAFRGSKDAAVFTVFIEDSAALLGIVVAVAGIGLGQLTGNPYYDPGASVVIGLILVGAAFMLARETGALLVGETMGVDETARLRAIFDADAQIEAVGKLLSMQMGPDEVLLTASVQFKRGMRIDEVEVAIARLEQRVNAQFPSIKQIYFESGALRSGWGPEKRDVAGGAPAAAAGSAS